MRFRCAMNHFRCFCGVRLDQAYGRSHEALRLKVFPSLHLVPANLWRHERGTSWGPNRRRSAEMAVSSGFKTTATPWEHHRIFMRSRRLNDRGGQCKVRIGSTVSLPLSCFRNYRKHFGFSNVTGQPCVPFSVSLPIDRHPSPSVLHALVYGTLNTGLNLFSISQPSQVFLVLFHVAVELVSVGPAYRKFDTILGYFLHNHGPPAPKCFLFVLCRNSGL